MKELDREVSYDVRDLNENQLREFKKECVDQGATGVFNDAHNKDYNDLIRVNKISVSNSIFDGKWCIAQGFEGAINALTLFEPQFKQGDKVLYTDDLVNWEEGIFLVKHNESYIVESDEMLLYAIEIKPYEEEIKVGDWVMVNDEKAIIKINEQGIKYLDNYTKITDEVLINKLNEL